MREATQQNMAEQLKAGVTEPENSARASPVALASEKDGQLRFCIDHRRRNKAIVPYTYQPPRLDDCIDCLRDFSVFWTLDAN